MVIVLARSLEQQATGLLGVQEQSATGSKQESRQRNISATSERIRIDSGRGSYAERTHSNLHRRNGKAMD